jgi:Flp pilus assembly protein TadG
MIDMLIGVLRRQRSRREEGAVLVELAIVAPVLISLVLGVTDYGILMGNTSSLEAAVRAGAEYAKANWNNPSITNAKTITEEDICGYYSLTLSGSTCSPLTPTVASSCTCVDNTSVTCPSSTGTNPCAAKTDTRVLKYVTVSATRSLSQLFAWASFAFPTSLTASAVVRTQ